MDDTRLQDDRGVVVECDGAQRARDEVFDVVRGESHDLRVDPIHGGPGRLRPDELFLAGDGQPAQTLGGRHRGRERRADDGVEVERSEPGKRALVVADRRHEPCVELGLGGGSMVARPCLGAPRPIELAALLAAVERFLLAGA